jgi:hypothetical protein
MPVKNKVRGYYCYPRYDPGHAPGKVETRNEEDGRERGKIGPTSRASRKGIEQAIKHCGGDEREGRKHKRRE